MDNNLLQVQQYIDSADNDQAFTYAYIESMLKCHDSKTARKLMDVYGERLKKLLDTEGPLTQKPPTNKSPAAQQEAALMTAWRYSKANKPLGFIAAFLPTMSMCGGNTKFKSTTAYKECMEFFKTLLAGGLVEFLAK